MSRRQERTLEDNADIIRDNIDETNNTLWKINVSLQLLLYLKMREVSKDVFEDFCTHGEAVVNAEEVSTPDEIAALINQAQEDRGYTDEQIRQMCEKFSAFSDQYRKQSYGG